jgi:hypothetical protein
MNVNDSTLKTKHALTHNEAQLVLGVMDLDKLDSEMSENELLAVGHYVRCAECKSLGIAKIKDRNISCKEAVLVCAEHSGAIFIDQHSLRQQLAIEHIWGIDRHRQNCCLNLSCERLRLFWDQIPMSSHSDGPQGPINLFYTIAQIFKDESWAFDELFVIQKIRFAQLIEDIKNGKITISTGHYHSIDELVEEAKNHLSCLQQFALEMYKW